LHTTADPLEKLHVPHPSTAQYTTATMHTGKEALLERNTYLVCAEKY